MSGPDGHIGIVGPTKCGKSTLAKQLARDWRRHGRAVFVRDPIGDPEWARVADWVTECPHELMARAKTSERCLVICDEAGDCLDNSAANKPLFWFARRSRHPGHRFMWIAQEWTAVWPTYRTNTDTIIAFKTDPKNADELARNLVDPGMLGVTRLKRFEFFRKDRFAPIRKDIVRFGS